MNNYSIFPKNKCKGAEYMKKLIIITGCMAIISILITANSSSYHTKADTLTSETGESASLEQKNERYVIKEYQKRLAVFEAGKDEPMMITGVFISELPKADRELMKTGISAYSRRELDRLLEDYCS